MIKEKTRKNFGKIAKMYNAPVLQYNVSKIQINIH